MIKSIFKLLGAGVLAGALGASVLFVHYAHAYPTNSPSAIMAARLKYHPPNNWIRHYLGDDRYKVAGGIWKVVSTQLDTYYHRANCPNMLRQEDDIVIGFANWDEAEQGGYVPDPYCQPRASTVVYVAAGSGASAGVSTINRTRRAMRIVLADGKSTVLLPPNWRRTQSGAQTVLGYSLLSDTLQPLTGSGSLRFAFVNAPGNLNVQPFLTTEKFPQLAALASQSGNNAATNYLKTAAVSNGRLGGRSGVTLTPKAGTANSGLSGKVIVVARGAKVYVLENDGGNVAGVNTIVSSFQPR